jgi:uncharacterized lipoprotein NlpE involved in copper resistance
MKLIQIVGLAIALCLSISCKNEQKETTIQTNNDTLTSVPPSAVNEPAVKNSPAAAGWAGRYKGTLPCEGDCTGITIEITLNADKTYTLISQALGRDPKPSTYTGTFYLDEKNIATLDAEGDHLKFLLQEGSVKKLDKFGDEEQLGPASSYILPKME